MVFSAAKFYITPTNHALQILKNVREKKALILYDTKMKLSTFSSSEKICSKRRWFLNVTKTKNSLILPYHRWKWRSELSVRGFAGDIPEKYNVCREKEVDEEKFSLECSEDSERSPISASDIYRNEYNKSGPVGGKVIKKLETSFDLTNEEAFKVLRSPKFYLVADAAILDTISCLADFNISGERIKRSPWLLLQSADDITEKLNMVVDDYLFRDYCEGLGFCYFGKYKIKRYQKLFEKESKDFPNHRNRIYTIADMLLVSVDHLTDEIVKVQRLLTINFYRVETYVSLLNKYNIRREDILNDLWIFFNNIDLAERRLQRIINAGCTRPKLWMCRCSEEVFHKTVRKYETEKDALGDCLSLEEYLMKRLDCTKEELTSQMEYNKGLQTVSARKIQRVIDLLILEGFTTFQILHSLRILKHSETRTAERIRRLKNMGIKTIPMNVLYKSPISFESYCDNLTGKGYGNFQHKIVQ